MELSQILQQVGGVDAIARELNISPDEAQRGAAALLPSILHGFGQREASTETPDGGAEAGGLGQVLSALGGAALTSNVTDAAPTEVDKGNSLLGHIFGSKDVSRDVATQASASSGVNADTLKKMLPILAMLVGGYLATRGSESGGGKGLGGVLGPLLSTLGGQGGAPAGGANGNGGLGSVLGSVLGSFLGGRR